MDLASLKQKLVDASKILYSEGLLDYTGHLSARASADTFLITPRFASFSYLSEVDLISLNVNGEVIEGSQPPPLESPLHQAIYLRRDDVKSVIHTHSKFATVLAIAGVPLKPLHQVALPFLDGVPTYDYFGMIDTLEKGKTLAQALGTHRAIFLVNHGAVIVGSSVEEACILSIWLERAAEMQLLAGKEPPNLIRDEQEATKLMKHQLSVTIGYAWNHYKRKVVGP